MTVPIGVLVVVDDYFGGCIYTKVRVYPRVSVSVYVCFSHCYPHRKLQLAFSTPGLVYDAIVFFLLFHRFSVVVGCGIWLPYFMIINFYRHRRVFDLPFQMFRANVQLKMKFHIQYS